MRREGLCQARESCNPPERDVTLETVVEKGRTSRKRGKKQARWMADCLLKRGRGEKER